MTKRRLQSSTFVAGFIGGIALFIGVNVYSLFANYGGCLDCYGEFGFPFTLGDERVFKYGLFRWVGAIADIAIAVLFSFVLGYVLTLIWPPAQD